MSYLSTLTRGTTLTIGGATTGNLVSWQVSDSSAYKNGCIQTTGNMVIGKSGGGRFIQDYDRNLYRRGTVVTLDITDIDGTVRRHPRGYLYIISTSFNPDADQLEVELGCRLVMMSLTDEIDDLVALVPVELDVAQTTYENCSAAFASVGQYVYQDNQGNLQTGTFFDGDGYDGVAAGEWVSILGTTTQSVSALQASGAIPDEIKLSYQIPVDGLNEDNTGRVDTNTTESYYFLQYPAVGYVRKNTNATTGNPTGTLGNITGTATRAAASGSGNGCGSSIVQPGDNGTPSCNEGYELRQEPIFIPAYRIQTDTTEYNGPGAQQSYAKSEVRGPAIEANQQYYADTFAFCRSSWATGCQPNGGCPYYGEEQILISYTETVNYYGEANELVRTIQDTYVTTLSAAQPSDWRSGIVDGIPQDFNQNLSTTDMYRVSRVDTTYYQEGNINVQKTDTYASLTTRGVGIKSNQSLDALDGVKTTQIRRSTSTATVDIAPDRVNSSTTATEEQSTLIRLFTGRFTDAPPEAGPYVLEEQIPVPLLFDTEAEINNAVATYENYITRFVKGDTFGLQIGEALRSEVLQNWYPGMPFRYYDTSTDEPQVVAMRMDACSWGVSTNEAAFVTNGIWIGFSNGSITLPSNVTGNSSPDMNGPVSGVNPGFGAGTPGTPSPTPPPAVVPPSVDNETSVDSGTFAFDVDVHIMTKVTAVTYGNDGVITPLPDDLTYNGYWTTTCFVTGFIVETGDLLATEAGGSIPTDLNGSLITVGATVVNADLFA